MLKNISVLEFNIRVGMIKIISRLKQNKGLSFLTFFFLAQCCPNLEHINLSSVKVTNVSLQQLAIKCPKLKVSCS